MTAQDNVVVTLNTLLSLKIHIVNVFPKTNLHLEWDYYWE